MLEVDLKKDNVNMSFDLPEVYMIDYLLSIVAAFHTYFLALNPTDNR